MFIPVWAYLRVESHSNSTHFNIYISWQGFFIVFTIALVQWSQCPVVGGRIRCHAPLHIMNSSRCFDYFVLQRLNVSGLRQHLALVAFWILVGMGDLVQRIEFFSKNLWLWFGVRERCEWGYNLFIAVRHGSVAGRIRGTRGTRGTCEISMSLFCHICHCRLSVNLSGPIAVMGPLFQWSLYSLWDLSDLRKAHPVAQVFSGAVDIS